MIDRDPPLPAAELLAVLRPSLEPCAEFDGACRGETRWAPERGHIPRGWIGATGSLAEVRLVLVTAEPGDPADGEGSAGAKPDEALRSHHDFAYAALEADNLRRGGRAVPFQRNLRLLIDYCWPGLAFREQMRSTWILPTVLCSASVSGAPMPRLVEQACGVRYLFPQMRLLNSAFVIALGGKAKERLQRAGFAPKRPLSILLRDQTRSLRLHGVLLPRSFDYG